MKNRRYPFYISFLMGAMLSLPALSMEKEALFTDTLSVQQTSTKPLGLLISEDILENAAAQYEKINHAYQEYEGVFKYLMAEKCMKQLEDSLTSEKTAEKKEILRSALSIQGLSLESMEAIQTILIGGTQELDIITSILVDIKSILENTQMSPDMIENLQFLLHPYTRTHMDILHNIFGWNGENTGAIVLENNFSRTFHMEYIANLEEDCFNVNIDTHGLNVASIIASHHPDAPGVARGATVIPAFTNYKYMSLVNKKDRIHLAQLKAANDNAKRQYNIIERITYLHKELDDVLKDSSLDSDIKNNRIDELFDEIKELKSLLVSACDIWDSTTEGLDDIENEMKDKFISFEKILLELKTRLNFAKSQGITPYVINRSLVAMYAASGIFSDLAQFLEEHDLLLVNGSGNDADFIDDGYQEIFDRYPALYQRIIFAGSMDTHGNASSFSTRPGYSYADCFIYAPGESVKVLSKGNRIVLEDGTSFSSPFISGLLVLLKKYFSNLDMITLKDIVLSTATPFPSYLGYGPEISGCGMVNAWQAFMKAREASALMWLHFTGQKR